MRPIILVQILLVSYTHLLPGHTGLFIPEDPCLQLPAYRKAEGESSQAKERQRALTRGTVRGLARRGSLMS